MLEGDLQLEDAIKAYQKAAEYYDCDNSASSAQQCRLKSALFMAQLERYREAIDIYQAVAREAVDSNLLKWSAKDYFLRAVLCFLAENVRVCVWR